MFKERPWQAHQLAAAISMMTVSPFMMMVHRGGVAVRHDRAFATCLGA